MKNTFSQQTFVDGDLENWTATGNYFNPSGGFLTSLNQLNSLGGPITCERIPNAPVGSFAAKLTTKSFGTFLIPGLLASGTFDLNNLNSPFIAGKPFNLRPESFGAFYKYEPVNGDSALLYCALTKWNPNTKQRDTVGVGNKVLTSAVANWESDNINIIYRNEEIPDTVNLIFSSSTAASFNNLGSSAGEVNSSFYIDQIVYTLSSGLQFSPYNYNKIEIYPNPTFDILRIKTSENIKQISIFDINGRKIRTQNLNFNSEIDITNLQAGTYIVSLENNTAEIISINKIVKK